MIYKSCRVYVIQENIVDGVLYNYSYGQDAYQDIKGSLHQTDSSNISSGFAHGTDEGAVFYAPTRYYDYLSSGNKLEYDGQTYIIQTHPVKVIQLGMQFVRVVCRKVFADDFD